jgi:hypothetical protein
MAVGFYVSVSTPRVSPGVDFAGSMGNLELSFFCVKGKWYSFQRDACVEVIRIVECN